MTHQRRVVITGMGAITPLGHNVGALFKAACEGQSGVRPIRQFDASKFPTSLAAEVLDFNLADHIREAERFTDCGVNTRFALGAARQALADSGLLDDTHTNRDRFGIYLGSGEGIHDFPNLISAIALSYRPESRKLDAGVFYDCAMKYFHLRRES